MTSHETVNRRYSDLQTQLRLVFGAEGRGLSEMVRSVENDVPTTLSWELRAIAHIRNKVVHEGLAEIPRYFEPLCKEALAALKRIKAEKKLLKKKAKPPALLISNASKVVKKPTAPKRRAAAVVAKRRKAS